MNSHILFFIFFFISVIHPIDIPNINLYIAMGLFSLIGIIFLITLFKDQTWKKLFGKYKPEIYAIALFLLINIISTLFNWENFNHSNHFFRFSLTSIAVWLLFPMAWVIYSENNNKNYQWIGWSVILILGLVALWQLVDIQSAYAITQFFIGAELSKIDITSLTHLQNEYAVIASIAILTLLIKNKASIYRNSLLMILLLLTGILTGSRIFSFICLFAGLFFILKFFSIKPLVSILILLSLPLFLHLFISSNNTKMSKYIHIFPYLKKINTEKNFKPSDFIPHVNNQSLNGRLLFWRQGIEKWEEKKWFGIGTGGYRVLGADNKLAWSNSKLNLHNYYLQVLVETGIIGLIVLSYLLFLFVKKSIKSKNSIVLLSIMASMFFDNLLDYSAVWVITISWLLFISSKNTVLTEKRL